MPTRSARISRSSPPSAAPTARWASRSRRPGGARLRRSVGLDERDGLLVRGVEPDSVASSAGIQQGDLIVAVGESPISTVDDLLAQLETGAAELQLKIVRGGDEHELTAPLEP